MTPPLLAALERYFGRPYPYEKLDLIAVPEFWPGAMENPGAITFRDQILLLDPAGASAAQRRTMVEINAHELAHMWFGDLVTMAWWDDLWLNESFASWMGDKVDRRRRSRSSAPSVERRCEGAQRAMNTDARLTTRAIRQPVTALDNLLQAADELAYQKGAGRARDGRGLGRPRGLPQGRARLPGRPRVGERDRRRPVERALEGRRARTWGGCWPPSSTSPACPLVTRGARGRRQARAPLAAAVREPRAWSPPKALWQIPVSLKYAAGGVVRTQTFLLTARRTTFELDVKDPPVRWVHPNADERGYYRWSVPRVLLTRWRRARRTALDDRARARRLRRQRCPRCSTRGALRGDDYLRLLAPFASDPEPVVVSAVIDRPRQGEDRVRHAGDARARSPTYVRRTLGRALERIGPRAGPGEPESAADLRPAAAVVDGGRDGDDPGREGLRAGGGEGVPGRSGAASTAGLAGVALAAGRGHERRPRALRRDPPARWRRRRSPADRVRLFDRPRLLPRSRPRRGGAAPHAGQASRKAVPLDARAGLDGRRVAARRSIGRSQHYDELAEGAAADVPGLPAQPRARGGLLGGAPGRRAAVLRRSQAERGRDGQGAGHARRRRCTACMALRAREGAVRRRRTCGRWIRGSGPLAIASSAAGASPGRRARLPRRPRSARARRGRGARRARGRRRRSRARPGAPRAGRGPARPPLLPARRRSTRCVSASRSSTTRVMSPMRAASAAATGRAGEDHLGGGARRPAAAAATAATGGKQPTSISGWPKTERGVASTTSQKAASSQPPPRQRPSTAATVAWGSASRQAEDARGRPPASSATRSARVVGHVHAGGERARDRGAEDHRP